MERYVEIRAQGLRVGYDNHVALSIDNLVARGRVIALLGHNGAGKSTFIKSTLGLLPPRGGTLSVDEVLGESRHHLLPEQHMAFCPETGAVFADISVESYLRLWCRFKQRDPNYYRTRGSRYIELLGVAPLLDKRGRELSKGQRRRVQTAIGFLIDPALFLFDEPFDGLDVQRTAELARIIGEEAQSRAIMLSSHRMDVIERLADYVVVLRCGEVAAHGSLGEVCRALCPVSARVRGMEEGDAVYDLLRSAFPHCVVSRIGDQLTIAGRALTEEELGRTLAAGFSSPAAASLRIEIVNPSLVDAMTFHLREVALEPAAS